MFPIINHIDDILPHVKDVPGIVHIEKEDYQVLDYVYVYPELFQDPWTRECRGIKFDKAGNLIARPFHKFFNLNEREETRVENLDWEADWILMNKLDGSMIHPVLLNDKIVLMTRKGVSDVAVQCMDECEYDEEELRAVLESGHTPIFEYTSPRNRIVVDYDRPFLHFLQMREMSTGIYKGIGGTVDAYMGLDRESEKITQDPSALIEHTKNLKGAEGYVLRWPNGHMVKLKADEYVSLHRSIDTLAHEKRVLEVILNGNLDDLLPIINEDRRQDLINYAREITRFVNVLWTRMGAFVAEREHMDQKSFALDVQKNIDPRLQSMYFMARRIDYNDYVDMITNRLLKQFTSQDKIDSWRDLINVDYYVKETE